MEDLLFIPGWGVWIAGVFAILLFFAVLLLKKEIEDLENRAEVIEEVQEAKRKQRE